MSEAIVVDTNVFSASLVPRAASIGALYQQHLQGRNIVLAAQSVAEMRFGALDAAWGPKRQQQLEAKIALTAVAPYDDEMVWAYARLRHECRKNGHSLEAKHHDGDRWIAATAIRYAIALVSHDGIFRDVPGLNLITELR